MAAAPTVYGKYELLERLAEGGMAEVYKARSRGVEGFEKILVVKRILPPFSQNARFVDLFINEAKISVTLSHANVVQVFDLGKVDDTYFLAMEYVAGLDLAALLARSKAHGMPLPPELAVYIASEVAKALDYAHRRRDGRMEPLHIVHRDVSPQNILISHEGEVKLTDFGIARAFTQTELAPEQEALRGKLVYMSPEQASLGDVDAQSDLYSLGVVLYEMLAGQNPFVTENVVDTMNRVQRGDCLPLHKRVPSTSLELSELVARIMSPDKAQRVVNASKLYEELIQFLFASGRRVGAHELSRYLDDLRDAAEAPEEPNSTPFLRKVAQGLEAVQRTGAGVTSIESPLPRPSDLPGRHRGAEGAAGASDLVTLMVARFGPDDETPDTALKSLIRRFNGHLVRRGMDGNDRLMVALFGVGSSSEGRDVEEAARCALRIVRLAESAATPTTSPRARVVVHATTLPLGADARPPEPAIDAELSRVSGWVAMAAAGEIVVSKQAERALRLFFHVEPKEGDEGLFRVLGERTITEAFGRFVGRHEELKRVGEVLALANRGKRRLLVLVGEEGVGKSRLLHETLRRLRLGNHPVGMHLVAVTRSNRDVPFSTVREVLRTVLGIDEFDPEPIVRRKIDRLRELGLSATEIRAVRVNLGLREETGADATPSLGLLRAALGHIVRKLAEDRLTVIAIDGASAIDDESLVLLNELLEDTRRSRLAMILTYRSGTTHHRWREVRRSYEIHVPPLDEESMVELIQARTRARSVHDDVRNLIISATHGNPLHAEEYIRALLGSGIVRVRESEAVVVTAAEVRKIPDTIRDLLGERLEALAPEEQVVLRVVSVAGTRIAPQVIAHVVRVDVGQVARTLATLEQLGMVARRGTSEYGMAAELLRELVVRALSKGDREALHGSIATALEQVYPQRLDEMAERLAEHHRQSGAIGKAIDHWVRSADRLESQGALDSAIGSLSRAIELIDMMPAPDRERVLGLRWRAAELCVRARQFQIGEEFIRASMDAADNLGRDDYLTRYTMLLGRLLIMQHRLAEGHGLLDRARGIARGLGNRELLRDVTLAHAEANVRNGRFGDGIEMLEEALELSRDTGNVQAQVRCLLTLAIGYAARGNHPDAVKSLDNAEEILGVHPDRVTDLEVLAVESTMHFLGRRFEDALASAARGLDRSKEYGLTVEAAAMAHQVGLCQLYLGQTKQAYASFRMGHELAKEHGHAKTAAACQLALGFIDATQLRSEEARQRILDGIRFAEDHGYDGDLLAGKFMLALVEEHLGRAPEAERILLEASALAKEQGNLMIGADAETALRTLRAGGPLRFPLQPSAP